jgi:hypothetical protein
LGIKGNGFINLHEKVWLSSAGQSRPHPIKVRAQKSYINHRFSGYLSRLSC